MTKFHGDAVSEEKVPQLIPVHFGFFTTPSLVSPLPHVLDYEDHVLPLELLLSSDSRLLIFLRDQFEALPQENVLGEGFSVDLLSTEANVSINYLQSVFPEVVPPFLFL